MCIRDSWNSLASKSIKSLSFKQYDGKQCRTIPGIDHWPTHREHTHAHVYTHTHTHTHTCTHTLCSCAFDCINNIVLLLPIQGTQQTLYFHDKCYLQKVINQEEKNGSITWINTFTQAQLYWEETCFYTCHSRGFSFLCIIWGSCIMYPFRFRQVMLTYLITKWVLWDEPQAKGPPFAFGNIPEISQLNAQ